jgi:calcineurin-like phosphoesterase family protein
VVRVLAVSDEVVDGLTRHLRGGQRVDVILACGDLPFGYLDHLMAMLDAPLAFVPGNHDPDLEGYRAARNGLVLRAGLPAEPPWPSGAVNADVRVVDVAGLRIAGLGGSRRYRTGPNQYTDHQQARRARQLMRTARWRRSRDGKPVNVLLTHAPPLGVGDGADDPHRGFATLHGLIGKLRPPLLLHGHVHPHGETVRDHDLAGTVVRNVVGWHLFDVDAKGAPMRVYNGRRAR